MSTGPTGAGTAIYAVATGTVFGLGSDFIDIQATPPTSYSGSIFRYFHMTPAGGLGIGDPITIVQNIGTLQSIQDARLSLIRTNDDRSKIVNSMVWDGFINYVNGYKIRITNIDLLKASNGVEVSTANPTNVTEFNIRARIRNLQEPTGDARTGAVAVGYGKSPSELAFFTQQFTQTYRLLPVTLSELRPPEVPIVYDVSASVGHEPYIFEYFANNFMSGSMGAKAETVKFEVSDSTQANICVLAQGVLGPSVTECTGSFIIDVRGASLQLRTTDGTVLTGATNRTSVVASATDTYGLQKFVLSGPTTATQTVTGTTGDYTFAGLTPDAAPYTIAVYDLAGNVTSGGFTTPGPSFSVEDCVPA